MSNFPKVNFVGNKRNLTKWIISTIPNDVEVIFDVFSGSSAVSYEFKKNGYSVISNDVLYSNYVISKAIIENSNVVLNKLPELKIEDSTLLNETRKKIDFLDENLYFKYEVDELAKILCIAEELEGAHKYIFLALLRRAMIRKLPYSRMNVPWNQILKLRDEAYSYEKYGRKRAYQNKSFYSLMNEDLENYNESIFNNGKQNISYNLDAFEASQIIGNIDLVYLDPPYPSTMNKYHHFYDKFDLIFDKNNDYVDFTDKNSFLSIFLSLISILSRKCKYILISMNNKSRPSIEELCDKLNHFGKIEVFYKKHEYKVTNKKNKKDNIEYLILIKIKEVIS